MTGTKSPLVPRVSLCLFLLAGIVLGAEPAVAPQTAYDLYLKGNACFHEGDYENATAAFRKSVALDPAFYFAQVNLGVSLAKMQRFEEAIRIFTRCIDEQRGPGADRFTLCLNRALACCAGGQAETAEQDHAILKELDPARAKALGNSQRYVLMDSAYIEDRNLADRDQFFAEHKTAIEQGEVIVRRVAGAGKHTEEYEALGLIAGTLEEVSGVLADYEQYPEFMPNVKQMTIKQGTDNVATVDWELALPMGYVKKYRLRCWARREGDCIHRGWKKLPWPGLKPDETIVDTYGQWILEPFPGQTPQVLAYYRVYTDPGRVPLGTGWIVDIMSQRSVPDIIRRTRERVHRLYHR